MTKDAPYRPNIVYLPLSHRDLANPFRPGTKKARCFEIFRSGGARQALIADMQRLGVARSTACTWLYLFRVFARGIRTARERR